MIKLNQLISELKLTNDMRIHMSKKPFELEHRTYTQKIDVKPQGFWYGFGSEWIDWCRAEMPDWVGKYVYSVDIGNANVFKINDNHNLSKFGRLWRGYLHPEIQEERMLVSMINWKEFVQEEKYDGIEINPHQNYQDEKRGYLHMWYYGWDVASGCVWNLNGVKVKLLTDKGIE